MKDICKMLGIEKLNTTTSHPQCNGVVKRFNQTLKTMLRKQAAKFGVLWYQYLSGVLWAYHNPHPPPPPPPPPLIALQVKSNLFCYLVSPMSSSNTNQITESN